MNQLKCSWCSQNVHPVLGLTCECKSVFYCSRECCNNDSIIHDAYCKLVEPIQLLRLFNKKWIQRRVDMLVKNFELGIRVYVVIVDRKEFYQEKDKHFFTFPPDVLRRREEYERFYKISTCIPSELISSPNYFPGGSLNQRHYLIEKDVYQMVTEEDIYRTFLIFNKLSALESFNQDEGLIFMFSVDVKTEVTHVVMFSVYNTIENSI